MSDSTSVHSISPHSPPNNNNSLCSYCCSCLSTQKAKDKFAGVEYQLVPTTGQSVLFNSLPEPEPQKSFTLPQSKAKYVIPLQLEGVRKKGIVTSQPRRKSARSISEPNPPPGFIPDPSMFGFERTAMKSSKSMSERNLHRHSPHSSPRTSPLRSSPPYSSSPMLSHERQISAPAGMSLINDDGCSTSWRPSLSAIEDVEEPQDGGAAEGLNSGGLMMSSANVPPEIEYSLYYDIQCRTLMVHLQCVHNLPVKGKKVSLNPITLLYLLPNREDIFHSKMIENSNNPVFNQSFEFTSLLPDEIRRQTLVFRVFSHSAKGDLLGGLSIPLSEADLFGVMCLKYIDTDVKKLKLVSRGDLLISLTYNPTTQKLQGLLLKATNLQKQDIVGLADPYVKIWLLKKGRRNQKWKSKVKRNTLIPIFNEPFQFDLSEMSVRDVTLEILMMDYDRFSRNDIVGVVFIGHRVPHNTGQQHWDQMISQPNTSISSWHSILPLTPQLDRTTKKRKVSKAISSNYDLDEDDD